MLSNDTHATQRFVQLGQMPNDGFQHRLLVISGSGNLETGQQSDGNSRKLRFVTPYVRVTHIGDT